MAKIDEQKKKIAAMLLTEQKNLHLTENQMAERLGMSNRQYSYLLSCKTASKSGYCMDTLNKIFDNTNINSLDIFENVLGK